jgi:hypothetical protein
MLSHGVPRWKLCTPPSPYVAHRSAPHMCTALEGTHGGVRGDPDGTRAHGVRTSAPHTYEPLTGHTEACAGGEHAHPSCARHHGGFHRGPVCAPIKAFAPLMMGHVLYKWAHTLAPPHFHLDLEPATTPLAACWDLGWKS